MPLKVLLSGEPHGSTVSINAMEMRKCGIKPGSFVLLRALNKNSRWKALCLRASPKHGQEFNGAIVLSHLWAPNFAASNPKAELNERLVEVCSDIGRL